MKTAMKKLFSLVLVAALLVSAVPTAFAATAPTCDKHPDSEITRREQSDVAPTCTEAGKTAYRCLYITDSGEEKGHVIYVDIPAAGHSEGNAATCTTDQTCTECGEILVAAPGHTEGAAATCTTDQTCTECGEILVEALGHTEGDAATCTTAQICTECGEILVEALSHNYEDGECTTCGACEACGANPCECVIPNYTVTINVNKDGSNRSFTRTYAEGESVTLDEELVGEVDFGDATVEWVVAGVHYTTGESVTVEGNMTISCSITNAKTETKTITLNANGGRLQTYETKKYTVVLGQPYGNLPTPTRSGYEFAYWYYKNKAGNEVRVDNNTIVETANTLYAKWIANGMTVTFQRYDMIDGWVDVEEHTVPVNSKLTIEDGTFPNSARIDVVYDISGFDIIGWKVVETGASFKEDSTKVTANITLRPRYEGTVKLVAQEPVSGASWKTFSKTVVIGETIGKLTNPGSRSTYSFDGWLASNGSDLICDRSSKSTLEYYPHLQGTAFYVRWAGGVTVRLHIHVNGNTSTAAKIIPYYVAPAEGEFDLKTVNLYNLYSSYYKYDDDCDKSYGWYDAEQWKNYCANRAAHPATVFTDIEANGQYDFHIMLINNGDDSSSSSSSGSSGTADTSNPKTGDMIFTAVTVMGASAVCLAALFFLNKKRAR